MKKTHLVALNRRAILRQLNEKTHLVARDLGGFRRQRQNPPPPMNAHLQCSPSRSVKSRQPHVLSSASIGWRRRNHFGNKCVYIAKFSPSIVDLRRPRTADKLSDAIQGQGLDSRDFLLAWQIGPGYRLAPQRAVPVSHPCAAHSSTSPSLPLRRQSPRNRATGDT